MPTNGNMGQFLNTSLYLDFDPRSGTQLQLRKLEVPPYHLKLESSNCGFVPNLSGLQLILGSN
jgi:hypothetical protein